MYNTNIYRPGTLRDLSTATLFNSLSMSLGMSHSMLFGSRWLSLSWCIVVRDWGDPNMWRPLGRFPLCPPLNPALVPCACNCTRFVWEHDCDLPIYLTPIVGLGSSLVSPRRTALPPTWSGIRFRLRFFWSSYWLTKQCQTIAQHAVATGVESRQILGAAKVILPEFPKFARKILCGKPSPNKFSLAVGYTSTHTN